MTKIYHYDSYGKRKDKYEHLSNNSIDSTQWQELKPQPPYYFFVPKDFALQDEYDKGFKISELFDISTSGIKTHDDKNLVSLNKFDTEFNQSYSYRPFDTRYINYDLSKVQRHRYKAMRHMLAGDNVGIVTCRNQTFQTVCFISNILTDLRMFSSPGSIGTDYLFPLYTYPDEQQRIYQ